MVLGVGHRCVGCLRLILRLGVWDAVTGWRLVWAREGRRLGVGRGVSSVLRHLRCSKGGCLVWWVGRDRSVAHRLTFSPGVLVACYIRRRGARGRL